MERLQEIARSSDGRIELQPDHACDNQRQAKDANGIGRFAVEENSDDDGAGGSNPRPNSIGGAEWQGAQRKRHQSEAESDRNKGCNRRPKPGEAVGIFQAQRPSDLKQASAKKVRPMRSRRSRSGHCSPLLLKLGSALIALFARQGCDKRTAYLA